MNEEISYMFLNDCMWTVFYLGEEFDKFKRIAMNHQIPKRQTITETSLARLGRLEKPCLRISLEFHYGVEATTLFQTRHGHKAI